MTRLPAIAVDGSRSTDVVGAALPQAVRTTLLKMFADPSLLESADRTNLLHRLRECVELEPERAELRVLLGMALCVTLEPEAALEQLQLAVTLDPDSFVARLKLGELWMRLRVCRKAEEETRLASRLASNPVQIDLARRQATAIRTMLRQGIERGGYKSPWLWVTRLIRRQRHRADGTLTIANFS